MSNKEEPIGSDLLECWNEMQENGEEYMQDEQVRQWVETVAERRRATLPEESLNKLMSKYIQKIHGLNSDSLTNLQFKYDEACDFYQWITQSNDHSSEDGKEQKNERDEEFQEEEQRELESKSELRSQDEEKPHIQKNKEKPNQSFPELIENEFEEMNRAQEDPKSTLPKIGKNYLEYLSTIFEHYCRMSYATGNDPTFEQIQQKTQVMTINKFMIFCKDFGILGGKAVSRAVLVELFKKNAKFYKEMSEEQFIDVLKKIADLFYAGDQQEQNEQKYERLLAFMEVDNLANFKKKAVALGIVLKPKLTQSTNPPQIHQKNIRIYKKKLNQTENDGEVVSTKKIKSESKIQKQPLLPRNPSMKKSQLNSSPHSKSFQVIKQQQNPLPPPIPPARKISQTASRPPNDPAITGYANIHRLKQSGRSSNIENKFQLNTVVEEAKKIIYYEEDTGINRMSEYSRETPYSHYSNYPQTNNQNYRGETESEQTNSRQEIESSVANSKVIRSYEPYSHSQLSKSKNVSNSNLAGDLYGIIGNDSDEDEYLEEHLNREKKKNSVGERIERKIKELEQRMGE